MATRSSKRRRLVKPNSHLSETPTLSTLTRDPVAPATVEDRLRWKGFCEIESEPASYLTLQPVYGLVFLFKWRAEDPDKQEQICPEGIWFANQVRRHDYLLPAAAKDSQTAKDACASVALLNIVNNIPEIELGENLRQFKNFTTDFTPSLRGDAISNFDFVKAIHNSFARKMDMLNADLQLKNDALPRRKAKTKGTDDEDAGFHFIAFVPIQGNVWKLDGLERQPQKLGPIIGRDWLVQVAPEIESRMAQYGDDQIEFAVLALVKEPLSTLVTSLAQNVKSIRSVMRRLDCVKAGLKDLRPETLDIATEKETIVGPSEQYYLDQLAIDRSKPCDTITIQLEGEEVPDLVGLGQELISVQAGLRVSIMDEARAIKADDERAANRRNDKGLLAKGLLHVLERMDKSKSLFECDY
ncbi:MAG: hypothetical protein LQ350_002514 [Teloschistes chrysophthalmus]|nr:MAG: hypothetical protein LQ350_002514 [Niorma chrysophthalma]